MKNGFLRRVFYPSNKKYSDLSVKERAQIPVIIFGAVVFTIGFAGTTTAEFLRRTYLPMIFSIAASLSFLTSLILLRNDRIKRATTMDTIGMLIGTLGITFFLGMGVSPLELYRTSCFIVVAAIFNQLFAMRDFQVKLFNFAVCIAWITACCMEFKALSATAETKEIITAIAIGTAAIVSSLYGFSMMWKQNRIITDEAVRESDKAESSLVTIKDVLKKNSQGLEIGNKLNSEVMNVNTSVSEINGLYQNLMDESLNLSEKASTINKSSEEVMKQVQRMQESVHNQNLSLSQTSSAMTQISANLSNIAAIAEKRKTSMTDMVKTLNSQTNYIQELVADVGKVQSSSDSISAFVETVNDIAAQTGLLAMNASIEAAHAGNSGKGFSVIAQEIRKLSEQTTKNAEHISDQLKTNKDLVTNATQSATNLAEYTNRNNEELRSTINAIEEILAGIGEMSTGTGEVMNSLHSLLQEAEATNSLVAQSVNEISNQDNAISAISQFSFNLNQRVDALNTLLQKIKQAITNVNEVAQQNSETSEMIASTLSNIEA